MQGMQTIGFVGLGHMGGAMAARYLAAGYPVYGEERDREHAHWLTDQGLRWTDTPRAVAEAADIIMTSSWPAPPTSATPTATSRRSSKCSARTQTHNRCKARHTDTHHLC